MTQPRKQFAHLHVHSEFSLLDGLSRIDHLATRAKELNMPALALTDHGTMYGTIQFYRTCQRAGIKPILGVETYVASRRMFDRDPELDRERFHLLLLAENQSGYLNLLKIVSSAQLDGFYYRPRTDHDFLQEHSEGLITTTGCMAGEIPRAIQVGDMKRAHKLMAWYLEVFGRERFFVELQEHSIPELTRINQALLDMAKRYDLRFLATNDVHYTSAREATPHDVLLCIQTGKTLETSDRMRMSDQSYYLKSYDEMATLFGNIPGALENSLLIAEMCDVNPVPEGYHLPKFEVPEGYSPDTYLRHLCEEGLRWRYGDERAKEDQDLRVRLANELEIIRTMGFDAYFLIVWDLCEFARSQDIWWNVRGSGAGSVVAYTLGITGIDPLANGLIFERFLNPGRVSMPDIDLDYPDDRRHEMIEYAIRKYGSDKVAQIITFGTMGARAAIRDVGRVLDVSLAEVDEIAKLIPAIPGKPATIHDVLNPDHEFYSAELNTRYQQDEQVRELVDTAQSLEGVARHASTHAAGVIISDKSLVEYAPLHRPTSGTGEGDGIGVVTQWPMEICESIGLLKVDFLGLSTLTVLRRAAELIKARTGVQYTMENIPYDIGHIGPDPDKKPEKLFELLGRGEVAGVFQVEGAGMRRLMMQMKPHRFDNIIAAISLYRPGPMENIPEYIDRMHGKKMVVYHHADLEPILNDTYGILVYQEQIIRIASEFAGYPPGEADMIRKAVAKKKQDLMDKHRAQFIEGAMARGYQQGTCEAIWGDIEFFARYGFNKAHAADYAVITCQTAFLKAHYPVEYMAALLSVERNNTDKVALYLAEARRMGITVEPPEINRSVLDFTIEETNDVIVIRYGLGAIKNAGTAAIELILENRGNAGPFADLPDLCKRVDLRRVGKRALESMIKVGVFDKWGTRPQLLDALDRIIGHSGKTHEAAAAGQMSLFGAGLSNHIELRVELLRPTEMLPSIDQREILDWEKELIGVYISEHPVSRYASLVENIITATTSDLDESFNGRPVTLLGLLTYLRTLVTKKGDPMAFGNLEDLQGTTEIIFFPNTWKQVRAKVQLNKVYIVRGKARIENGDRAKLVVDSVEDSLSIAQPVEKSSDWTEASGNGFEGARQKETFNGSTQELEEFDADEPAYDPWETPPSETSWPGEPDDGDEVDEGDGFHQLLPSPPNLQSEKTQPMSTRLENADSSRESMQPSDDSSIIQNKPVQGRSVKFESDRSAALTIEEVDNVLPREGSGDTAQDRSEPDHSFAKPRRTILVKVRPVRDWKHACRELVQLASEFHGEDALQIQIAGSGWVMDFPNQQTHYCADLEQSFDRLPAVIQVEVA